MLLLYEFDLEIKDKKGVDNVVADHLSRIEREPDLMLIRDDFPDEQLTHMDTSTPWFVDICNFIVASQFPPKASRLYKEKIKSDAKYYIWDDSYHWKRSSDQVIRIGAFQTPRSSQFSTFVMQQRKAATMDQCRQPKREFKKILQKLTNAGRKDRMAYRTPLGMSPYQIVFGKAYHLPIELEHQAYWTVKKCNMTYDQAGEERKFQLQELEELHLEAYENSRIYKQRLIVGKLRSRWDGPFFITNIFPYGVVELKDEHTNNTFQVNRHQIKIFHEGPTPIAGNMDSISLMEPAPSDDTP
ncbi:hypothetical protein CR513_00362, partial [Mucuna pruriens]